MKKTYVKGIDVATIKLGNKIWFKENEKSKIEEGVVTHVEGNNVWAIWEDKGHQFVNAAYDPTSYGTVKSAEGKQYRLAVFYKDSPIVIACNHIDFQQEFEESPGFVYWLTDWNVYWPTDWIDW